MNNSETKLLQLLHSRRSKRNVNTMVHLLQDDEQLVPAFMNHFFHGNKSAQELSAWVVGHLGEQSPYLLTPYINPLLKQLKNPESSDAVKRNITRILIYLDLDESQVGECLDVCYQLFLDRKQAVAVRVFSMSVVNSIVSANPELKEEFFDAIDLELKQPVTAAFRNRAGKILTGKR